MAATSRRTLHFVFKVADRTKTVHFYKNVLGMKILRHEEFEEGCKASCNGYANFNLSVHVECMNHSIF